MKLIATLVFVVLVFQSTNSQETDNSNNFIPEFNIKGRLMFDYGNFDYKDDPTKSFTGSDIRRALFETSGKFSEHIGFKFQIDFARQISKFKEVIIFFDHIPKIGGRLAIGNIWVPFSLEQMTSNLHTTFMERATTTAYLHDFGTGFLYENFNIWNNKIGIQLAYTANGTEFGSLNYKLKDGQNLSTRFTFNPIENQVKNEILHFGFSYTNIKPVKVENTFDRVYLLAVRPEANLAIPSLSYLFNDVKKIDIGGLEGAYRYGSISVQGEYVNASVSTKQNDFNVPSYYVNISYFLTGEYRPKSSKNTFGRIRPYDEFNFKDKWGAIELAARYSSFDLTSVNQGELNNFTFGINWYLTSYAKIMYNYIHSNNPNIEIINMHLMRFQIDFSKRVK